MTERGEAPAQPANIVEWFEQSVVHLEPRNRSLDGLLDLKRAVKAASLASGEALPPPRWDGAPIDYSEARAAFAATAGLPGAFVRFTYRHRPQK